MSQDDKWIVCVNETVSKSDSLDHLPAHFIALHVLRVQLYAAETSVQVTWCFIDSRATISSDCQETVVRGVHCL